ncbi:hypothetical protein [Glutamicibacter sp.]|uniref:hypothetical protein n=1 Tax=Glutamicibacter sp. TaxID=1931995 RepID=UPI0028BDFFB4|nr:hypothetical protein [Glutamicibacter sp.]
MTLETGVYEIITATGSIYELSVGQSSTLRRLPGARPMHRSMDGARIQSLRRDEERVTVLSVEQLKIGRSAQFILDLRQDGVPTFRFTSEVLEISRIGDRRSDFYVI